MVSKEMKEEEDTLKQETCVVNYFSRSFEEMHFWSNIYFLKRLLKFFHQPESYPKSRYKQNLYNVCESSLRDSLFSIPSIRQTAVFVFHPIPIGLELNVA